MSILIIVFILESPDFQILDLEEIIPGERLVVVGLAVVRRALSYLVVDEEAVMGARGVREGRW